MQRIKAFIMGMQEFRLILTSGMPTYETAIAYDWGREIAHRLTLRRYEQ